MMHICSVVRSPATIRRLSACNDGVADNSHPAHFLHHIASDIPNDTTRIACHRCISGLKLALTLLKLRKKTPIIRTEPLHAAKLDSRQKSALRRWSMGVLNGRSRDRNSTGQPDTWKQGENSIVGVRPHIFSAQPLKKKI